MEFPKYDIESLARMRMQECQGTIIGGLVVATGTGMSANEFGYQMMMRQGIRFDKIHGDLEKIARVFHEHYQTTYGFGEALKVELTQDLLSFRMPPIAKAAAGQLKHWNATAAQLQDLQRGYWRSLTENAGIEVELAFGDAEDSVRVTRAEPSA